VRKLAAVAAFTISSLSLAQQSAASPPEGSNWQHVQALPAGANIHVKAQHNSATCRLKSVDADSLICTHTKDLTFARAEIKSIIIPRRGRSALISAAIGGGAGAIVGYAVGGSGCKSAQNFCLDIVDGKTLAPIGAVVFGAIGAGIGAATDFAHSAVYKAP
jgi:hypothetical protein